MIKKLQLFFSNHLELFFWIFSIIFLSLSDPFLNHFSICPLKYFGIICCPGCGFGNAVSFLLHGEIIKSIALHPFGIPGLIIIIFRLITLIHFPFVLTKLKTR